MPDEHQQLPERAHAKSNGKRFFNQLPSRRRESMRSILKWRATREPGAWDKWRPLTQTFEPPVDRVLGDTLKVTFVNHATVLLQTQGVNLLTDPVWSLRCSPTQWAGPKRHRPPGVAFDDLPPIDVVLLSHDHYDHLDLPTLRRLHARDAPTIVTGMGVGTYLRKRGVPDAVELNWWDDTEAAGLKVTAVPAEHFSGRGLHDQNRRLWIGHVVETSGGPLVFAGDTGWGPHFAQIADRFGPARLALLPIGAYRPTWFMSAVHISPQQAVDAHQVLRSQQSLAIHFGTFNLADDGQDEPVDDLREAMNEAGVDPAGFVVLDHGEACTVPALERAAA